MNLDVLDEDNIKHRRLLAAASRILIMLFNSQMIPVSDLATNLI